MDVWHKYVVTWIFTKYYKYKVLNVEMTIRLLLDVIANQCPREEELDGWSTTKSSLPQPCCKGREKLQILQKTRTTINLRFTTHVK